MAPEKVLDITYSFRFDDGVTRDFHVLVDQATGTLLNAPKTSSSSWARLEFRKCRDCKLQSDTSPFCPVALSLESLVQAFRADISHKPAHITVRIGSKVVGEKELQKDASLQQGLQSIFGLLMVTSGCPAFGKLKPMATFHNPFSTPEETVYRVTSMHMLAQYFRRKQGLPVDLEFKDLEKMYEDMHRVNVDFVERLRTAGEEDANLNGVVSLDSLTMIVPLLLEKEFRELRPLFAAYLDGA